MAHVPDLNDFVAGFEIVLAAEGVVTVEVPHLLRLVEDNQFDTIYHEHFQYFSFLTAQKVFAAPRARGLRRRRAQVATAARCGYYAQRASTGTPAGRASACTSSTARERALGFDTLEGHLGVHRAGRGDQVEPARVPDRQAARGQADRRLRRARARATRCSTTAASAPTCSSTRSTATRTSRASSCPGTHIPILHPEVLEQDRPDYILILPWNLKEEIVAQLEYAREWGAQFVVPIPQVEVL